MAKKRFRSAMSGYNKDDVNKYIENMMDEYEAKIVEKETVIKDLNKKMEDMQAMYDDLKSREDALSKEKAGITKALMKANELSDQIVKEAKDTAFKEVAELEVRAVSYTHLRAHETVLDLVCRLLLEKKQLPILLSLH